MRVFFSGSSSCLAANGDAERATEISRCRAAAQNSDGWSVDHFLSLFGYMGDFNSAGLPGIAGDHAGVNARFNALTDEALRLAKMFQQDRVQAKLEAQGRTGAPPPERGPATGYGRPKAQA